MTLPILLSVPHAGLGIPPALAPRCLLTPAQVARDGDEGAREIYALGDDVLHLVTTDVARCVLDLNRAEDDVRKDGITKTHTCFDEPVWATPLARHEIETLLETVHRPYHRRLTALAHEGAVVGIDAHTMAAVGPPVGPDTGRRRPAACLGIGDGTCPEAWASSLQRELSLALGDRVTINDPFSGGWITRSHAAEMPWLQLELARVAPERYPALRTAVRDALRAWSATLR